MADHEDYDIIDLIGLGIAMVEGHAVLSKDRVMRPAPNSRLLAKERMRRQNPGRDMRQVGWVSLHGNLYSDAMHEANPDVPVLPVYAIRENR
jgi:hypothetical protein